MIECSHRSSEAPLLPRGVRGALDAMRADPERDWSVAELAAIARMSGRTLQRQFRMFLGKAPGVALRDIRFECARRELLQSRPDVKVMDVALRCGFTHSGRFSVEYRLRYGETPSQTVKRQAVFAGAVASAHSFLVPSYDRPTVALEPIEAGGEHDDMARAIADELTTALMRAGASVTSRMRSASYRMTGAIRGTGRQTRLTLRLVDGETGRHLSAHRTDGALDDASAPVEHLATRIVAALQPHLRLAEIDRATRKAEGDLTTHDLVLRAMPGVLSLDADGNARALDLLERAMDRDPGNALAVALAAWARVQRVAYHFATDLVAERAKSVALAQKALTLAGDATVLAVLGNALTLLHDLDTAELVIRKALAVDGGSAWAWSRSGFIDMYKGDANAAIERFKIALDLAPHDSLAFNSYLGIGCAHFAAGRYRESAQWQERALIEHPSATWVHRTLCPAYVVGGAQNEARRSFDALRRDYPELTIAEVRRGMPPVPPAYRDLVVTALLDAGLPA